MKKKPHNTMRIAAAAPSLRADKKVEASKTRKAPAKDAPMKDMAYDRNFTRAGTPRLNATSDSGTGERAMGQRR